MSEFYNKYRRLFNDNGVASNNRSQFLNFYKEIATPKVSFQSPQMQSKNGLKNMGRSPALDQFQREILPRLKTEPDYLKRDSSLQYSPGKFSYELPQLSPMQRYQNFAEITNLQARRPQKQRPNPFKKFDDRFADDRTNGTSWNEYQRQYSMISKRKPTMIKIESEPYRSVKTQQKDKSITSKQDKHPLIKPLQRDLNKNITRRKGISAYEEQLYGINENPYAFVHSKLDDIRLIDRFCSRGTMNQYKRCLLRRRQMKDKLQERREKLRCLLEEEGKQSNSKR